MSITGEPGGAPVKAGVPLTDLSAGLFALVGILAARRTSPSQRRRPAGRHVARRRRRRAVGVGSDRVFLRDRRAGGAGIRAPDERAVSGDPLRRRLHHARRRQRAAVPAPVRGARPSRVGGSSPSSPTTPAACANRQLLAERIEAITARAAAQPLARAVRSERHPVRADQRLRAGVRGSAGRRAGDGGRDRASDARAARRPWARRSR